MLSRFPSFLGLLALAVESQPTFPSGIDDIMRSFRHQQQEMEKVVDHHLEGAVLAKLETDAKSALESALNDELIQTDLSQVAYETAHLRVLKLIFAGGCSRDTRGCPKHWTKTQTGTCAPGDGYIGFCGPVDLNSLSAEQREEFAWKCKAAWPCKAACKKDFGGCPLNWRNVEGLCSAPRSYDGPCSVVMRFDRMSRKERAEWSERCLAPWMCSGVGPTIAGGSRLS